jgi:hypothetical protein
MPICAECSTVGGYHQSWCSKHESKRRRTMAQEAEAFRTLSDEAYADVQNGRTTAEEAIRDNLPDVRECPGCEDDENAPHAGDCRKHADNRNAALLDAARVFASTFDGLTCSDLGGRLTCNEAEAFADLLTAAGRPDHAEALMGAHTLSDEPGDLHHPDSAGEGEE